MNCSYLTRQPLLTTPNTTTIPLYLTLSSGGMSSGRKTERQVFLRPSIASAAIGHDIENLGRNSPVLLALKSRPDPEIEEVAERSIALMPDILVTDVNAVAQIAVDPDRGNSAPLRSLVRSNLVEAPEAFWSLARWSALLLQLAGLMTRAIFIRSRSSSTTYSSAMLLPRLHRAAQLLEMGITGDLSSLESEDGEQVQATGGKLSDAEIRILLPYLLRREDDNGRSGILGSCRFAGEPGSSRGNGRRS